jgi:hypothetical protein
MTRNMNINEILEELDFQYQLVDGYRRRLRKLQVNEAAHGNATEPHVLTEIEDVQRNIQQHNEQIETLEISSNLIRHSIPSQITNGNGFCDIKLRDDSLVINFRNGSSEDDWSGVFLKLNSELNVQEYAYLKISGTASHDFTLSTEYKVRGTGDPKVVTQQVFEPFPKTQAVSTITIPMKYSGKVHEITLMFYVAAQESQVTIESVHVSR